MSSLNIVLGPAQSAITTPPPVANVANIPAILVANCPSALVPAGQQYQQCAAPSVGGVTIGCAEHTISLNNSVAGFDRSDVCGLFTAAASLSCGTQYANVHGETHNSFSYDGFIEGCASTGVIPSNVGCSGVTATGTVTCGGTVGGVTVGYTETDDGQGTVTNTLQLGSIKIFCSSAQTACTQIA